MKHWFKILFSFLGIYFVLIPDATVFSQVEFSKGWKQLTHKDSLEISFLFYSKADNFNNGVVLKIENKNPVPLDYSFDIIFRSDGDDKIESVLGKIEALQVLAGSTDSLFWIPFGVGKFISEVGITNLRIIKKEKE